MIMEAEKSHHLLFASWKTRKAGGVIQSNPQVLRTGKLKEMDIAAQKERK